MMSGSSPLTASTSSSTVETVTSLPPAPPVVPLAKPKAASPELLVATLAAADGEDELAAAVEDEVLKEVGSEVGASTDGAAELVDTLAMGDGPSA
jgi:hypothetical protein